jgi:hypothetical protein
MEKIQKAAGMLSTLKDLTSVHTCDLFVGYFSQPHKDGTRTANGTDAWESPGLETKDLWWWNPDRESYMRGTDYISGCFSLFFPYPLVPVFLSHAETVSTERCPVNKVSDEGLR